MTEAGKTNNKELLNRTLLAAEGEILNEPLDLTNCEKEPIHIPGSIQPHGVLLAIASDTLTIIQSSTNTGELLGIEHTNIVGQSLKELIPEQELDNMIQTYRNRSVSPVLNYMQVNVYTPNGKSPFFAIMHDSEDTLIVELEPGYDEADTEQNDFQWIQSFFNILKQTKSRVEASQVTAEQLRLILGYDRVMIYEFDSSWNGKVIAEAKKKGLEPYLGHHYPASDIPRQARELYLRNWLRLIVDVGYKPVPILPVLNPRTDLPLNLSLSTLRSVSPMHIEYLQNMGVQATMTISLIHDGQLWGLVTCHHNSVKYVPHRIRNLCNFLGVFFSSELYQRLQLDNYQEEVELKTRINRLSGIFIGSTTASSVMEQLAKEETALLDVMKAGGAAVCYQGELALFGAVPGRSEVEDLACWLSKQSKDNMYHTSNLSREYRPAEVYKHLASGVMYTALSSEQTDYIIWFRPEVVQVVEWAGDPAKAVIQENDGLRLSPRKSFEKWRQVLESTSLPWRELEIRVIPDFNSVLLKRTEQQLHEAEEKAMLNKRIIKENEKRYLQLMDISSAAFFTVTGCKIVYCNDRAAGMFRADSNTEIIDKPLDELFKHENEGTRLLSELARLEHSAEQMSTMNETLTALDGTELNVELTAVQVQFDETVSYWIIVRDRAEGKSREEGFTDLADQLQNYMNMDPLTEISNRQFFEKSLYHEWEQCVKIERSICLMMLDIDNFKLYNTIQGFQGGDLCLQWVADVLSALSTEYSAFIARYSGGTFALYLTGIPRDVTVELAENIRQAVLAVQIPADLQPAGNSLTVSIGVSCMIPTLQRSHAKLIRQAEKALAQAKKAGKNQVVYL